MPSHHPNQTVEYSCSSTILLLSPILSDELMWLNFWLINPINLLKRGALRHHQCQITKIIMNSVILIADSSIHHAPFAIVLLLQNYDLIPGKCFDWIGLMYTTRAAPLPNQACHGPMTDDPCLLFDDPSATKCPHLLIRFDSTIIICVLLLLVLVVVLLLNIYL